MVAAPRQWYRLTVVAAVALLVGCTSSPDDAAPATTVEATQPASGDEAGEAGTSADDSASDANNTDNAQEGDSAEEADGADTDADPAPLRPYDDEEPPAPSDEPTTSVWVTRSIMTADLIEIRWSAPEGAAEYHVHRMPRDSETRPDAAAMTEDNLIHVGEEASTYADDTVVDGTRYWYGVRGVAADGSVLSAGWHRADAVTDEQPPDPVGNLQAELVDGEAVVTWTEPNDNYSMYGYTVARVLDGGEPEIVVTTWDPDQTSFIDGDISGASQLSYQIYAFDFHWNDSAPAEVSVQLP